MTMRFDIERNAQPLLDNISNLSKTENLGENITDLILIIEGLKTHVPELDKDASKKLLDKTKGITRILVENEEEFLSLDADIKDSFNYLLRALSKLRSALHTAYTKDVPIIPTPMDFKEALSAVSRASVLHTLSKK